MCLFWEFDFKKAPKTSGRCRRVGCVRTLTNTAFADLGRRDPCDALRTASCGSQKVTAGARRHYPPPAKSSGHRRPPAGSRLGPIFAILQRSSVFAQKTKKNPSTWRLLRFGVFPDPDLENRSRCTEPILKMQTCHTLPPKVLIIPIHYP